MKAHKSITPNTSDTLILPIMDDLSPLLNHVQDTSLSQLLAQQWAESPKMALTPYYTDGRWIVPINCHDLKHYHQFKQKCQELTHHWNPTWGTQMTVDVTLCDNYQADAIITGLITGTYRIGRSKTAQSKALMPSVLSVIGEQLTAEAIQHIAGVALTQMQIMNLMNDPANVSNIQALIEWAQASGQTYGYNVEVLDTVALEALGMGALLAVGRAAPTTSHLLLLEYKHPQATGSKVALVGKGITFDTGGVSIKGSSNMHYMKSDKGGAAAVLGALEATAKSKLKRHVIGVVPLAENVIAGNALLPGDIIKSYSGKTIEVIDTDAEGRLILADALYYAQQRYQPDTIIDLATLTGSAVATFGYLCGASFSNDDDLSRRLQSIGSQFGERLWPLPLWEEYDELLYSDVADVRNLSTLPLAGCITAAKFLQNFINDHPSWIHLDIAGVAFGNTAVSKQKAGTAFGVKLLYEFLQHGTTQ